MFLFWKFLKKTSIYFTFKKIWKYNQVLTYKNFIPEQDRSLSLGKGRAYNAEWNCGTIRVSHMYSL